MSIETYTIIITRFYIVLFLLFILIGVVRLWDGIRKKTLKYWWMIPCSLMYLFFATCSTAIAGIAYDDPADPNYMKYKSWELYDFILNDIKSLIIWLSIGAVLYFVFEKTHAKKTVKMGCAVLLVCLTIFLFVIIGLSIIIEVNICGFGVAK